jgi:hypothetical protein
MASISCLLCLRAYELPEVLELMIPITEAGSMRIITICQGCATAINPALETWLIARRQHEQSPK